MGNLARKIAKMGSSRDQTRASEGLLLFFVALIVASIGFTYLPEPEKPITFPAYLVAEIPSYLVDRQGGYDGVQTVVWVEAHGRSLNGPGMSSWADNMPMDPEPDVVRIALVVNYEYPAGLDTNVSMSLDLPPGAHLVRCSSSLKEDGNGCGERPSPGTDGQLPRSARIVAAEGVIKADSGGASLMADIRGVRGFAFDSGRAEAIVRHPILIPNSPQSSSLPPGEMPPPPPPQSGPPPTYWHSLATSDNIDVYTTILSNDANKMRWTQMQSAGINAGPQPQISVDPQSQEADLASWKYSIPRGSGGTWSPPPDIRGTSSEALASDTNRVFYAGLAFGTAGAALIGSIQQFFQWLRSRKSK